MITFDVVTTQDPPSADVAVFGLPAGTVGIRVTRLWRGVASRPRGDEYAQIVDTAMKMGMSRDQAVELAKQMNAIPDEVSTTIAAPGSKATKQQVDEINNALRNVPPEKRTQIISEWMKGGYDAAKRALDSLPRVIPVEVRYLQTGKPPATGRYEIPAEGRADGGPIGGTSLHSRSDDKLILATSDEYMMRGLSHRLYGTQTMDAINQGLIDPAALRALTKRADGGAMSQAYAPVWQQPSRQVINVTTPPPQSLAGVQLSGELVMRDGRAYVEGIVVDRLNKTGRGVLSR